MATIRYIKPENWSGYFPSGINKLVKTIKKDDFLVLTNISVGGDAPKDFIKIYEYGKVRRANTKKWTKYIAKTGHKWYPNESITEHLLNQIGKELGLFMSNSSLAVISGQLRFLSEYFLDNQEQELAHGADIFAGYLSDSDKKIVETIEQQGKAREYFTFKFAEEAIQFAFPENSDEITLSFVKLLVFDALVGNNDRHFYNWAVVKNIKGSHEPYFSPIFDTARGLFWNDSEQKIVDILKSKQFRAYLEKYSKKSLPKTGWEGEHNLNHFELIEKIVQYKPHYGGLLGEIASAENEEKILKMIKQDFSLLLSKNRMYIITECLKLRFNSIRNIKV